MSVLVLSLHVSHREIYREVLDLKEDHQTEIEGIYRCKGVDIKGCYRWFGHFNAICSLLRDKRGLTLRPPLHNVRLCLQSIGPLTP